MIGMDHRGDPSSALLEVLIQNKYKFNDHYLEVDYDLSEVMLICTDSLNIWLFRQNGNNRRDIEDEKLHREKLPSSKK